MVNDSGLVVHLDAWQNQKQPHPKGVKTLKSILKEYPQINYQRIKAQSKISQNTQTNHYLCLSVECRASRNYSHKNQAPKYTG